jgi:Flp pilus assembly CpaE family ATPase
VERTLRESEVLSDVKRASAHLERSPGTLASFVPAHGDSRAGVVARHLSHTLTEGFGGSVLLADFDTRERAASLGSSMWTRSSSPRRLDGRTWGAFVSEVDGLDTLDARETHPMKLSQLLDHARRKYSMIFADLTGAREVHANEMLRESDAIFLVANSDHASVEGLREKAEWLRAMKVIDRTGLLLRQTVGGHSVNEIEEITGLPVCSLIGAQTQMDQLALWLAANTSVPEDGVASFAMAG